MPWMKPIAIIANTIRDMIAKNMSRSLENNIAVVRILMRGVAIMTNMPIPKIPSPVGDEAISVISPRALFSAISIS